MRKLVLSFLLAVLLPFSGITQEEGLITYEVAPYLVPCENSDDDNNCLQLMDKTGTPVAIISKDDIKNFKPELGFEYIIKVEPIDTETDNNATYRLQQVVSKMWIPQYAIDAPKLNGNFQVVGINGRAVDTNEINLIINANKSVMRGSTGCNNYHLFFEQIGYSLVFSKILASHLFCDSRSALEEEYFITFNRVHHFDLKGDTLRLYDIADKMLVEANLIRQF
jgi:heat shock protein HslJ